MSLYIPRLRRAVSDFLQLPVQDTTIAFEIIQEALYDARTVNSVYHLLISQASREPYSPFFMEKSVHFMRRNLFRFPPSCDTLECVTRFCVFALKTLGGNGALRERPALERSLHFLQTLVDQLIEDSQLVSVDPHGTDEPATSLKPSTLASARSLELVLNGIPESENGDLSSVGVGSRLGSTPNFAAMANSIGGQSNPSLESAPHTVRRTKTPVGAPVTPARRPESATRGMWLGSVGSAAPGDSQMHRRSRSESLAEQFVQEMLRFRPPLIWTPNGAASKAPAEIEDDGLQSTCSMRGLVCTAHLWTVATLQVKSSASTSSVEGRHSGSSIMGSGPLFQYRSYQQQESLQLSAQDISTVVETVCPSEKSQEEPLWGAMELHEIWNSDSAGAKPVGEACVTILIKLIMDMYIEQGPSVAYVLVLQMLQQSLYHPDVAVRVRAFDLVYNLALHTLMFSNTPDDAFFEKREAPGEKDGGRQLSPDLSDKTEMQSRLHTLKEETEDSSNAASQDPSLHASPWVRSLLFDLMSVLVQLDEEDVTVWSAAIACFFHVASENGEFMLSTLRNFPVSIVVKMLKVCIEAGWSDEVYSHLLRLLIKLLYLPNTERYDRRVINTNRLSQCGGIDEILLHLRTTRSMLDASLLVQLVIDYAAQRTNSCLDAMTPLVTHLLSPSAMDVIVSRFRRGEKGIGDILHVALQSCIIEKNVIQDSPKKPVHHRYKSHSSFLSSDTAVSIQPGVDPEALDTWKTILAEIDEMISHSLKKEIQSANTEMLGDPTEPPEEAWTALGQIMAGSDHNERMFGMRWLQMYFLTLLEDRLHEDRSHMSLLPEPPSDDSEIQEIDQISGPNDLDKVLYQWMAKMDDRVDIETSKFIEEIVSRLATHVPPLSSEASAELPARAIVHRMGTVLFRTLHCVLQWLRLLPPTSRRRPLLSLSFQFCQIVHAPHVISDISCTPPPDGLVSLPGPFIYNDYIFGTGSIYIRLLRLAPIEFLLELISDLEEFCPQYHDEIGFFGRPGHNGENKNAPMNVPWTDTVSDMRAALVLLLLHRCSMDIKGKGRLEEICASLRGDADVRVRYVASRHLLKYIMEEKSATCRTALRHFVAMAQQKNNEQLVDNPYLQVQHILESGSQQEEPSAD